MIEEKIIEKLKNIEDLLKIQVWSQLSHIFDSAERLKAFELTDGEKSTTEIGKEVGVTGRTILNWSNDWESQGLVSREGDKKQFKRKKSYLELYLMSLEEEN